MHNTFSKHHVNKKLAIIGASYLQLPLVLKARDMGIDTLCFAWEAGAVCKREADEFCPVSITEKERIAEICRQKGVAGVTSIASDVAVPTMNHVAICGSFKWKLVNDLYVDGLEVAIRMLRRYALGWEIKMFHKILKSGCRAEAARLRTVERLVRLVAVFCILSWRVFWMTMLNRTGGCVPASVVFTAQKCAVLEKMEPDLPQSNKHAFGVPRTLSQYIIKLASFGGYLA